MLGGCVKACVGRASGLCVGVQSGDASAVLRSAGPAFRLHWTLIMSAHTLQEALGGALAASPGVVSAYLFGSAAAGREHRENDVDLGVLLPDRT